jgi:predicted amidohydrolase
LRIAEPPDGPSVAFLREQAMALGVWVCGSVPERTETNAARPSNTLVLAQPDGKLHRYRKRHPFSFAKEHEHYLPATSATVEIEGVRTSLFICYDLASPMTSVAGHARTVPGRGQLAAAAAEHWRPCPRAGHRKPGMVVGVNRVGEGNLLHSGDSTIIDPWGEVIAPPAATRPRYSRTST